MKLHELQKKADLNQAFEKALETQPGRELTAEIQPRPGWKGFVRSLLGDSQITVRERILKR